MATSYPGRIKMRKIIYLFLLVLLCGCGTKVDEYGVDESKYENIIHCETTDYQDGYSVTFIEQLYGNNGVLEYLYNEQLTIFSETSLLENTQNVEEVNEDGYSVSVKVDKEHGAIDTITRIDYAKISYKDLMKLTSEETYSEDELANEEKIARDMGAVAIDYCSIVK